MPPAPWEIRHVEMASGPAPLAATSANALWVVFRLHGAVLGTVALLPEDLPMRSTEVAALAASRIGHTAALMLTDNPGVDAFGFHPAGLTRRPSPSLPTTASPLLPALEKRLAQRSENAPFDLVSIVICTRCRADLLAGALESLRSDLARGHEVIVVDNGPDQATRDVVESVPSVRYVVENSTGLSRARNTGARAASHRIVVFLDDDVRPEPGWLESLLIAFAADDTMIATGLVLPASLQTPGQIGFEFGLGFGGMGFLPLRFDRQFFERFRPKGVPAWTIGAGACSAYRREAFERIGGFDERLGPGAAGGCGDDSEFWYRALASGMTARYEPLCVVRHIHRADADSLRRQAASYMHGHSAALLVQFRRHGHWGNLRRAFRTMPIHFAKQGVRRGLRLFRGDFDDLYAPMLKGYLRGLAELQLLGSPKAPVFAPCINPEVTRCINNE